MNRESSWSMLLPVACLAALLLACFHRVLLDDQQFAYRDAAHFYYPLYERVQREWNAGRWPLWEPEENAGMPLMGNPTAAVLYPGKIIYATLPYAWAARLYIVAHVVLAFGTMLTLMRSLGSSWTAGGLSALAYTFGGPILFQYCNVIYLVGAAWLPLGFMAVDRWVRNGSRRSLFLLAVVLAMQTLGGDPQAAYLLGLSSLAYAAGAAWTLGRGFRRDGTSERVGRGFRRPASLVALATSWTVVTLVMARLAPSLRPHYIPPTPTPALSWMLWAPKVVPIVWAAVVVGYFLRKRPSSARTTLGRLTVGLGLAAVLAGAITAAQLLPVVEFTQQTVRAAEEGPHEIYPFSVEPFRVVEFFWPNFFGTYFQGNASWLDRLQLGKESGKVWVPTLYVGAAAIVLAMSALSFRRGDPARVWFSWIVLVTLVGSFGAYTSPIWATRFVADGLDLGPPPIGELDPAHSTPLRKDGFLRDGDGGVYWAMTTFLPGFKQFRFPSKLMTFSVLGIAVLGGLGWDDLARGKSRRSLWLATGVLIASVVVATAVIGGRGPLVKWLEAGGKSSAFGPFDAQAAYAETRTALLHATVATAAVLAVARQASRRPALAGALVLLLSTVDLGLANRGVVVTAPQSLFETPPEVLAHIRKAERANPADGPFRIHRSPIWNPVGWLNRRSRDRVREFLSWERDTLQPKYGINLGVEYTHTIGVAELYDYEWYFGGFPFSTSPEFAKSLGIKPGEKVVYFPRRSFDMWNTRYFVLPSFTNDWMNEDRGFAAFVFDSEIVVPRRETPETPESTARAREWAETKDYQIRRNRRWFPRAWVVHGTVVLPQITGMSRAARTGPMMNIMYDDLDPIWRDPTRVSHDPREVAWIEEADVLALAPFARRTPSRPSEKVQVSYPSPTRVELAATLESPGILVLSDVYYPGWKLTIDGEPATAYRVNRMMRGAALSAGPHKIVYTYEPTSFRLGLFITAAGLLATLGSAAYLIRRPRSKLPWTGED